MAEGAVLRTDGSRPAGERFADGHYYLPTVLDDVKQGTFPVTEESFGPVLTVELFTDEDDAARTTGWRVRCSRSCDVIPTP
jgi:betaine-aldehyde dehydrogenase